MFNILFSYYRFLNKLYEKRGKNFFVRILGKGHSSLLSLFFSSYIPYTVKMGKNIRFIHQFHGIFISKGTIIGNNCTIHHHVTIGSSKDPKLAWGVGNRISPKIGNNVYIGANVCIIGNCVIGDNCVIGAGTTIANANIPANSIVVGAKYRIIQETT